MKKHACKKCFLHIPPVLNNSLAKVPTGGLVTLPNNVKFSTCPYYEQVFRAIESKKVVMNFSSFLYQTSLTNRFNLPRDLIIIDEAHNIEPQILDFISFSIDDSMLQKHGICIPDFKSAIDYATWFKEIKFDQILTELISIADLNDNHKESDNLEKLAKKYDIFINHLSQTVS